MTELEERMAVVEEAKTWLGTPYVSNGDIKGAGVDCGMFLVRVFVDCKIIPEFDPRPYPAQWAMHQRIEKFLNFVQSFGREVECSLPGDVVLFQFGHCWSHGAIIVDWPSIIHANPTINPLAKCRYDNWRQNNSLYKRQPRFFSAWPRKVV